MTITESVIFRINQLAKEQKTTIGEIQKKSALSRYTLKSLMRNTTKSVDLKTIFAIAEGFGITIQEFFNADIFDYSNNIIDY